MLKDQNRSWYAKSAGLVGKKDNMIKATLQTSTYLIYDTKTENSIVLELSEDNIQLQTESRETDFVFDTDNTVETRDRWRNIAALINKAMDAAERWDKHPKTTIWYNNAMDGESEVKQQTLQVPIEVTARGLKTITIDHDEFEIIETGTKEKNGKVVYYTKYKIIK